MVIVLLFGTVTLVMVGAPGVVTDTIFDAVPVPVILIAFIKTCIGELIDNPVIVKGDDACDGLSVV